jgi:hypothetical protein
VPAQLARFSRRDQLHGITKLISQHVDNTEVTEAEVVSQVEVPLKTACALQSGMTLALALILSFIKVSQLVSKLLGSGGILTHRHNIHISI